MLGQAASLAAVLAIENESDVHDVDYKELRALLIENDMRILE